MLLSELSDQDVAILGAGREGLAAWRWLREQFPDKSLTIYDERSPAEFSDIPFRAPVDQLVCGPFEAGILSRHDVLIRSPGISPYREELAGCRERGVQFTSASSLWFARHPDASTICITGTKGKSTTAALVAHLLKTSGHKVQLAGNIGHPLLDFMDADASWWVIELSSYQLADLEAKPQVAAILNLTDEHLDWHGGSQGYQDDKLKIASLAPAAPLVANALDELLEKRFSGRVNVHWFGARPGFHVSANNLWKDDTRIEGIPRKSLPGPHNLMNLAAALTILEQAGINIKKPGEALQSFDGLPHRLQLLGQSRGVNFVSDSLSTTPVATAAALEALGGEKTILLVGGMDRGLDWRPFMPQMKELAPYAVICLPDNGSNIAAVLSDSGLEPPGGIQCATDLREAMKMASELARPGDTVLLSPGAPSFPHFRDYEDRGEQFAELAEL